jgi:methyl-CpG-binding domain protein 4|tara:strand:- start:319 stop:768 length:450 start_codon:yes stop_codon:yes gene_type:complete
MFTPLADQLMVQQQVSNSWEHFVGVIMLNLTNRKQVKQTLPEFLYWFPQPYNLLKADPEFVKTILRPLGMVNVRYTRLIGMTTDYLDWDGHDARELYGIGKYGSDSYEIFFRDNHNCNPTDKELKRYINENNPIDILVKGVYNTDYEYN